MAIDWDAADRATAGFPNVLAEDSTVMDFVGVMFDDNLSPDFRHATYDALSDYIMDEYGIDFDDIFDWDAYREWYG